MCNFQNVSGKPHEKVIFNGHAIKTGGAGEVEGRPAFNKKELFLNYKKNPTAIKLEGGGFKALMARPSNKITFFCGFPCPKQETLFFIIDLVCDLISWLPLYL